MDPNTQKYYEATKLTKGGGGLPPETPPLAWTEQFFKEYPRFPRTMLPDSLPIDASVTSCINQRVSVREFADTSIPYEKLATLLRTGLGKRRTRRGYPSAGARFQVETYLFNFSNDQPVQGIHHFNVRENSLELLLDENVSALREDAIGPFIKNAPLALVHTAVLSRGEVKYGANAYRFALLEAGHMAQNIYLLSTALGIGCCASGGTIADTITEALDLSEAEIPIYSLGLGNLK